MDVIHHARGAATSRAKRLFGDVSVAIKRARSVILCIGGVRLGRYLGKETLRMTKVPYFALVCASLAFAPQALADDYRGTPEEQAACRPDALKL